MKPRVAAALLTAAAFTSAVVIGSCAGPTASPRPQTPGPTSVAARTPGPAVAQARTAIAEALGARSVQLDDPQAPYRPAEATQMMGVPRQVFQAVLPADPAHGYIVVYDLPDESAARAAAEAQAAYVGSPVGRVQFSVGTQFVVRLLGRTVIFYADPPESPDDQAEAVVEALGTVGTEIIVPS